mgnify:FL=1
MKKKWQVLESREIYSSPFFRFKSDRCRLPDGRENPAYYIFEFADWVNVIPMTDDGKLVLIKQYRHGTGEVCIEVPGGSMDSRYETDPQAAGLRELEEETGYRAGVVQFIGKHRPNPALQNNYMHTYLATGCHKVGEPHLDPFEDIEVVLKTIPETMELVYSGQMTHSIILASLFLALPNLGYKIV